MQGSELNGETLDTILQVLSWLVVAFGGMWLVTSVIGYMHRRAYNLTRAESGGGKPITPDFLKVDKKKRDAAIARGEAYSEVLEQRAAVAASPASKAEFWSRAAALITATFTLLGAVVGTLTRVESLEEGARQLSSLDTFTGIVRDHPIGTTIAVIVIGANIVVFVKATKKTPARS